MFEVDQPVRNRCEEVYYFCNCDKVNYSSWGWGQPAQTGLRQPYEMKTRQRWILMIFILSAILVTLLLWGSSGGGKSGGALSITMDLDTLTERGKCPACYGVNLCPQMISGKIELSDWTKYSMTKWANKKNVYFAEWSNRGKETKLILKKLAHDNELDELDKAICERHGKDACDVSDSVRYLIDEYAHHSEIRPGEPILHGAKIGKGSDVLLCPSHRKMDYLVDAANKFNRGQHKNTILANVLTMVLLNPEPLLLQTFPASEGWPFPKLYGSCGRIVAEEFVGRRLTQYIDEPFKTRAYIAQQLLEMANKFGDNPSNMILYIGDPSADNFAVNEDTTRVKLIDLENIIVVDKEELILSTVKEKDKLLVSQSMPCEKERGQTQCFSFSTEDLCERPLTDHNYYAICAGLLAPDPLAYEFPNGLLHSIPEMDVGKLPQLSELLFQCKDPSKGTLNLTRVEAAQRLIELLQNYLKIDTHK